MTHLPRDVWGEPNWAALHRHQLEVQRQDENPWGPCGESPVDSLMHAGSLR